MAFSPRTETYINVSSLTTPFNASVTMPTGTVQGDIMFQLWGWSTATTIDSVPSGWTLVGQNIANTDRYALYFKIAGASEAGPYAWSWTATAKVRGVCSVYTSGDFAVTTGSTADLTISNTQYRTSDGNVRAESMSVPQVDSPLVFFGMVYSVNVSRSFAKPTTPTTGWVEDDDSWSTTSDFAWEVCSYIWTGSGATGNMDAVLDASATATTKHAFAVALRPKTTAISTPVDTLNLAEQTLGIATNPVAVLLDQETLSLADSLFEMRVGQVQCQPVAETIALSDSIDNFRVGDVILALADSLAIDAVLTPTRIGDLIALLSDSLQADDDLGAPIVGEVQFSLGEVVDLVEALTIDLPVLPALVQLIETLSAEESLTPKLGTLLAVLEDALDVAVSLSDLQVGDVLVSLFDALSAAEDVTPQVGDVKVIISDAADISESLVAPQVGAVQVTLETPLSLAEALSLLHGGVVLDATDDLTVAEQIAAQFGDLQVVLSEGATLADAFIAQIGTIIFVADESLDAFESLTVTPGALGTIFVNLSDDLTLGEVLEALPGGLQVAVLDALGLSSGAEVKIGATLLSVADALSLANVLSTPVVGELVLALQETATFAEDLSKYIFDAGVSFTAIDSLGLSEDLAFRVGNLKLVVADAIDLIGQILPTLSGVQFSVDGTLQLADALAPKIGELNVLLEDILDLSDGIAVWSGINNVEMLLTELLTLAEWALPLNYRQVASQIYDATPRGREYEATERHREYTATPRERQYEGKGE